MVLNDDVLNGILDEIMETHKESLKKLAGDTKDTDDDKVKSGK